MEGEVAIFWDYENCEVPTSISADLVVSNIRQIAQRFGRVTRFRAYADLFGTFSARSVGTRSELQCSGVSLIDCPHNGSKDVADKMMIVDMMAFAIERVTPATVLLISGDRDFAYAISVLRLLGYQVAIIAPRATHKSLRSLASVVIDWNDEVVKKTATRLRSQSLPGSQIRGRVNDDSSSSIGIASAVPKSMQSGSWRKPFPATPSVVAVTPVTTASQSGPNPFLGCSIVAGPLPPTRPVTVERPPAIDLSATIEPFRLSVFPFTHFDVKLKPPPSPSPTLTYYTGATTPADLGDGQGSTSESKFDRCDCSICSRDSSPSEPIPSHIIPPPLPSSPKVPQSLGSGRTSPLRANAPVFVPPLVTATFTASPKPMSPTTNPSSTPGVENTLVSSISGVSSATNDPAVDSAPVVNPVRETSPKGIVIEVEDVVPSVRSGAFIEPPTPDVAETNTPFDITPATQPSQLRRPRSATQSFTSALASSPDVLASTLLKPAPSAEVASSYFDALLSSQSGGASVPAVSNPNPFDASSTSPHPPVTATMSPTRTPSAGRTSPPATSVPMKPATTSAKSSISIPPMPNVSPHFRPLIEVMEALRLDGVMRPHSGLVGAELLKRDKSIYQKANVTRFKEYILLAQQEGIVQYVGTPGVEEWVSLEPAWHGVNLSPLLARTTPVAVSPPKPIVAPKAQPVVVPKPQPAVVPKPPPTVTPKPQPAVAPKPQPAIVPKPQPAPQAATSSQPRPIPSHFALLVDILDKSRAKGSPRMAWSEIGSALLKPDPRAYQKAGVSNLKGFAKLAQDAGLVTIGGQGGSQWISSVPR